MSQAPETPCKSQLLDAIDKAIARVPNKHLVINKIVDLDRGAEELLGYPRRFQEIIFALLENASQHAYGRKTGMIELRVRGRQVEEKLRYTVEVADFGAGIEPENLPRVFELFYTTSRQERAPGLGLAIVKSLVTDGIDGQIRVESQVGVGTVFTIDFEGLGTYEKQAGDDNAVAVTAKVPVASPTAPPAAPNSESPAATKEDSFSVDFSDLDLDFSMLDDGGFL